MAGRRHRGLCRSAWFTSLYGGFDGVDWRKGIRVRRGRHHRESPPQALQLGPSPAQQGPAVGPVVSHRRWRNECCRRLGHRCSLVRRTVVQTLIDDRSSNIKRSTEERSAVADQAHRRANATRAPGDRARAEITQRAAQLASIEGLDGLSIGRLAEATGVPKSSVYALFGSKEELQLATIDSARDTFISEVVAPALATSQPGRDRLLALCEGFLDHVERRTFPGGCFFVGVSAELGARPGRVHDVVAQIQQQWRDLLGREAEAARENDELATGTDPAQLAFELGAILAGTNIASVLLDDVGVIARARAAVHARLGSATLKSAPSPRPQARRRGHSRLQTTEP